MGMPARPLRLRPQIDGQNHAVQSCVTSWFSDLPVLNMLINQGCVDYAIEQLNLRHAIKYFLHGALPRSPPTCRPDDFHAFERL
jgi:hypothetical protein